MHPDEIVVSTTPEASPAPAEEVPNANIDVSQLTFTITKSCMLGTTPIVEDSVK